MILFKKIKFKNLLSFGNQFTEINLQGKNLLITGKNGSGKCVSANTIIKLRNKNTGEIYETTIEQLYKDIESIYYSKS